MGMGNREVQDGVTEPGAVEETLEEFQRTKHEKSECFFPWRSTFLPMPQNHGNFPPDPTNKVQHLTCNFETSVLNFTTNT